MVLIKLHMILLQLLIAELLVWELAKELSRLIDLNLKMLSVLLQIDTKSQLCSCLIRQWVVFQIIIHSNKVEKRIALEQVEKVL